MRPLRRRALRRTERTIRNTARRAIRRSRRTARRRTRLLRGSAAILFIGALVVKLLQQDVDRIEADTRKNAEDLSEDELKAAMRRLGIRQLGLDDTDREAISDAGE
ncbi:MAG: hypothetical protein JW910_04605 [Anaerolineae bacterium]|nr:hypothetical protein [Anaerolineae bacterium]